MCPHLESNQECLLRTEGTQERLLVHAKMLAVFRTHLSPRQSRAFVYLANLLVSFHYFLVVYINSTFLSKYISTGIISTLYLIGSVLSVILFLVFSNLVKGIGNYRLVLVFICLEICALAGLALAYSTGVIILSFILYLVISPIIYLNLDIFLEKFTKSEKDTGGIRGMFMTMQSITQVVAPLLVGYIMLAGEYKNVYLVSIGFLVAVAVLISITFRNFNDSHYSTHTMSASLLYILKDKMLNKVFVAQNLLRFFYAWMVIYTPLYLIEYIGFSWSEIAVVFSIMLLPFLLLELPLGNLFDSRSMEKWVMAIGFVIMGITVATIPMITTKVLWMWATVLFVSRIGAACVEMATESYFFRHVDSSLADTISIFRMARPMTYVLAAATATLVLHMVSMKQSFFVLAVLVLLGVPCAFALQAKKK